METIITVSCLLTMIVVIALTFAFFDIVHYWIEKKRKENGL